MRIVFCFNEWLAGENTEIESRNAGGEKGKNANRLKNILFANSLVMKAMHCRKFQCV